MQTETQKRKMSASTWILIFVVIAIIAGIGIASLLGIIDLSWLVNGFLGYKLWASTELFNSILDSLAFFALGILVFYAVKTYFIGNKITKNIGAYNPLGQAVTPQQQGKETTVS